MRDKQTMVTTASSSRSSLLCLAFLANNARNPAAMRRVRFAFMLPAAILLSLCGPVRAQGGADAPEEIAGMQAIRGSLVKITGSSFLVKTPKGTLFKVETSVNTHFVRGEEASTTDTIRPGELVIAGGELDEKQHVLGAVFLAAVDAQQLAEYDRRRVEFGKTWLAGTITAIHGTQLTIKRPDDVITTVSVDENTSFRKRHESITLGDIQVGDGLTARGTIGKGTFAGTLVTVVDAREIREWSKLRDR